MTREQIISMIAEPNQDEVLFLQRSLPSLEPANFSILLDGQEDLARIHPRHFESLVAELLRSDGYDEVHLIPRSNAPGPDVIAICQGPSGQKQEYIVECKRWNEAVGLDVVRQVMYQVDTERRSTGGIIVTTSRFTKEAVAEVQRLHQWRLTLKDGEAVLQWVNKHATHTRRDILGARRLEKLRKSQAGDLFLELVNNPHVAQLAGISRLDCEHCRGPVICGIASLGPKLSSELSLYPFHVCLICLHAQCWEVKEQIYSCPVCYTDFDLYASDSTTSEEAKEAPSEGSTIGETRADRRAFLERQRRFRSKLWARLQ